jgi:hypothetical protein
VKATIAPDTLVPARIVRHESTTLGVPTTVVYLYQEA